MATGWAVAAGDREAGSEQWYVIPRPLWPIRGTHKGGAYAVFLWRRGLFGQGAVVWVQTDAGALGGRVMERAGEGGGEGERGTMERGGEGGAGGEGGEAGVCGSRPMCK